MSSKISNIIIEIETKFSEIKAKLESQIELNSALNLEKSNLLVENQNLTNEISNLKKEFENLNFKLISSTEELESLKNKEISTNVSLGNKDVEIDFLVREIDQCINQIKNNL